MYQHKSWATFWSLLAVSLFFMGIYWNMRQLALHEQNQFQEDFGAIQVQIAGQIAKGYEKGNEVVENLNRKSLDSTERISFELMDQMLKGLNDEAAFRFMEAYLKNDIAAYALVDSTSFQVVKASERAPTLPSKAILNEWMKNLSEGEAVSKDAYTLVLKDGIKRPRLHLYKLSSKPWIIYVQIDESNKLQSAALTQKAILDRFSLLNSEASSDLIYLNPQRVISKSSKQELVGAQATIGDRVFEASSAENAKGLDSEYVWIELRDTDGGVSKYIGRFVGNGQESKYFISDSKLFVKEHMDIGGHLLKGVLFNILMGVIVIHLIANNYEYFIEGRHKRGGA